MTQIQTPNFAMNSEDVPIAREIPRARARARRQAQVNSETHLRHPNFRWAMQYFRDPEHVSDVQERFHIPQNLDLMVPQDLGDWPTDSIFDLHYGCVVFKRWGHREAI
jgi:hypothetical protein